MWPNPPVPRSESGSESTASNETASTRGFSHYDALFASVLGLNAKKAAGVKKPFKVRARPLGLRPGLNYDDFWGLIEQVEGPDHR